VIEENRIVIANPAFDEFMGTLKRYKKTGGENWCAMQGSKLHLTSEYEAFTKV
jgi:hypothetical protein